MGSNVNAFGQNLADFSNRNSDGSMLDRKVVCLSAGTAAVHLDLIACGVQAGDEVCVQSFTFCVGGPICALNIPAGQWYTLRALESGTVILEMKDGAYEPIQECDILIVQ